MNATNCDERRRVTFPSDLEPRSAVVIDTVIPGREWIVRVPDARRDLSYSRGSLVKEKNGLLVWKGGLGEEPVDALMRHRKEDDRAVE